MFLAACGVHEPSASASPGAVALAEGGDETSASAGTRVPADAEIVGEGAEIVGEGPRHIIFDLENISEHEKAAGAKSEGFTIGPCCDYNGSKPVLLCDLEIVVTSGEGIQDRFAFFFAFSIALQRFRNSAPRLNPRGLLMHVHQRFTRVPTRVPMARVVLFST